jgi:type I restriction enzyme, S subunit
MTKWRAERLSSLAKVFKDGDWIESKDQALKGIRLIQTGNIGNGSFKDRHEKARYISESTFKKLKCTEIFKGDLLISRLPDPVGRACILPDTGNKMVTAVDCTIIRFDENIVLPEWFIYYSMSYLYQTKIQSLVTGATRQRISRKNLGLTSIPIPPLSEQKRIVSILDKAFDAIGKAKTNAEENLKNSKELFDSYLNNIFVNKGEDWEEKTLSECFKLRSGKMLSSKMMKKGKFPVYGGNGIAGLHSSYNLSGDNIIIGRVGALCGNVRNIKEKIWLTDNAFQVIELKYEFDNSFLTYLLNLKNLRNLARQAAQPVISNSSLKDIILQFPKSLIEQKSIVKKLDAISTETKKLGKIYEQKLADLEKLKKSLLQKAFNGEL